MEVPHLLTLAVLPDEPGSFQTAHERLVRWAADGAWERILAADLTAAEATDDIGWTVSVDSALGRDHQHAAGAKKTGAVFETVMAVIRVPHSGQEGRGPDPMPS